MKREPLKHTHTHTKGRKDEENQKTEELGKGGGCTRGSASKTQTTQFYGLSVWINI